MSRQQQIEIDAKSEAEQREVRPVWGEQLREIRLRRGLSVDDVSNTLHLEMPLIEAIEAQDCERLPGASFVRGYLRIYAKLLEVDPEPLVEAYRQVCGDEEPALTQVTKIKDVSSRDAAPRYIGWFVLIAIAVSFILWWWSELPPPAEVETEAPSPAFGPQTDAPAQPEIFLAPPAAPSAPEPAPEQAQPLPDIDVPPVVPQAETPPAPVLDTLRLSFTADSWVEIEDSRGERLFMDLARAGQATLLEGEAPFKVLLGNASAVTLEYNGAVYEHAAQNRSGVARFTVGD